MSDDDKDNHPEAHGHAVVLGAGVAGMPGQAGSGRRERQMWSGRWRAASARSIS